MGDERMGHRVYRSKRPILMLYLDWLQSTHPLGRETDRALACATENPAAYEKRDSMIACAASVCPRTWVLRADENPHAVARSAMPLDLSTLVRVSSDSSLPFSSRGREHQAETIFEQPTTVWCGHSGLPW